MSRLPYQLPVIVMVAAALAIVGCGTTATQQGIVITSTTSSMTTGTVDVPYRTTTLAATGGTGALTWSVSGGVLPPGLVLIAAGVLSGTPTSASSAQGFEFDVTVTDSTGLTATQPLSVVIYASLPPSPVSIAGVIPIPGLPLTSTDIAWVDPATKRYYFADRSNGSVDVVDAQKDLFVGRAVGFVGNPPAPNTGGGTATTNGSGPNGVTVTPNKNLWAGDGNSQTWVFGVDPNNVATYLQPLTGPISTAWNNPSIAADTCDVGAAAHYCGRADELAFDPTDNIIIMGNPNPLSAAAPHTPVDPYSTFINANPPFNVLGHLTFVGAGGLEQPIWNSQMHRFLVNVPGKLSDMPSTVITPPSIQVINPLTMLSEVTYPLDCSAITGGVTDDNSAAGVGITGIAIAANQHVLVSACGFPIILTLNPGGTITVLNVVTQVAGGDEVWYNPGDNRFYVTGALNGVPGNMKQLGVINAQDGSFLQNVSELGQRGSNPAAFSGANAFSGTNSIFTIQSINAAIVNGTIPDDSVCATFNINNTGCIAVFTH